MNSNAETASTSTEIAPVEQPVTRSVLLGAEMLNWSDLEPENARPALGGPAALELLEAVLDGSQRVLVAGPHSLEVVRSAAERSRALDVLVRSYDDAETVAESLPEARVYAGGLDRFGPEHGARDYDVVVALDGVPRLAGPDTHALDWTVALRQLRDRLGPGGRLLVGASNGFGLGRLLDVPATPGADDWGRAVGATGEPPRGADLAGAIEAATGLSCGAAYAMYPDPTTPVLGMTEPEAVPVARAVERFYAGRTTLADPYRTAYDAVMAGHGVALAPSFWFVLGDGAQVPDRLGTTTTQPGELVEELLLGAVRADDHQELHRLVREYVAWLLTADRDTAAQASPDNTVADGTAYGLVAEGQQQTGSPEQLVIKHLARFVTRTLAAGQRWPWPAGGTPRSQTTLLASMASITVDDTLWAAAGVPDEVIEPRGQAGQLATIERLTAELADARTQVDWFEGQLDKLRKSRSYRVGRAIVSPLRTTYAKLRSRLR